MRILMIGGTHFVGHAMAEAALAAGHEVTLVHRNPTDELPGATHLLADRNGDLGALADGSWDATIDVCAYFPEQVARLHDALSERGGHHVFVSTVSVYADPGEAGADEDAALLPEVAPGTSEITNDTYGPLKVACERVARERWGEGTTIVRPTYVVGPRDLTGRYPWWVLRAARGGRMVLPGPDDAPMQCIDARDMGAWTVRLAEDRVAGAFTAARPHTTFGDFVRETVEVVGAGTELVPVDGETLRAHGVDGSELPMWSEGEADQVLAMSTARAEAAGLVHRPFAEVVRDTLAWAQAHPDRASRAGVGMTPERERELLGETSAG